MTKRLRNNLLAGLIVFAFWCIFVIPVMADPIVTQSTSTSTVTTTADSKTTVRTNPPSAISPSINSSNSDLCVVGVSGAVQTQILGISSGLTVRDMNCERLKNSKLLFDLGMKVAAVALLCQNRNVFDAMKNSGTPCPIKGLIGVEAQKAWDLNPKLIPKYETQPLNKGAWLEKLAGGIIAVVLMAMLVI